MWARLRGALIGNRNSFCWFYAISLAFFPSLSTVDDDTVCALCAVSTPATIRIRRHRRLRSCNTFSVIALFPHCVFRSGREERESEWGVRLRHIKLDFLFVQQVVTLARFCDFFFWRFFLLCENWDEGWGRRAAEKRENCWTICHALNMPLKLILKIIDKLMAWQWNETHF